MARWAVVAAVLAMSLLAFCPVDFSGGSAAAASDVVVTIETERVRYNPGEIVNIEITVRNIGTGTAGVDYYQWPVTYYYVIDCSSGYVIFNSRDHSSSLLWAGTKVLTPGEGWVDDFSDYPQDTALCPAWGQKDDSGKQVSNGRYQIVGCLIGGDWSSEYTGFIWIGDGGLSVGVMTGKTVYMPGESVGIYVDITNYGSSSVVLEFPTTLHAYYLIEDTLGNLIYNLKDHVTVYPTITSLTINPGQTVEYPMTDSTLAWDQVNDLGAAVPTPGYFVVRGLFDSFSWTPCNTTLVVVAADLAPTASFTYGPGSYPPNLVEFDASESLDLSGGPVFLEVRWDWNSDGIWDTDWSMMRHTGHDFVNTGSYLVTLEVRDPLGFTESIQEIVIPGSYVPEFDGVLVPVAAMVAGLTVTRAVVRRKDRRSAE